MKLQKGLHLQNVQDTEVMWSCGRRPQKFAALFGKWTGLFWDNWNSLQYLQHDFRVSFSFLTNDADLESDLTW